jgi:hypothetical protein
MHASRDLTLGAPKSGHELTLGVDGFNLLNRVNYAAYVGIISSPLSGTPVSARSTRQFSAFGALQVLVGVDRRSKRTSYSVH